MEKMKIAINKLMTEAARDIQASDLEADIGSNKLKKQLHMTGRRANRMAMQYAQF